MHWLKFVKIVGGFAVAASSLLGCKEHTEFAVATVNAPGESKRVLVVYNDNSAQSAEIAEVYVSARQIPKENVVSVSCPASEDVSEGDYQSLILEPVKQALRDNPNNIDFILLIKGVPIRRSGPMQYSVDASLAAMNSSAKAIEKPVREEILACLNPYFNADEPFSHKKFGLYLVTRIDGYTTADCKALIKRSLAAKREKGLFFFDEATNRAFPGSKETQDLLNIANEKLGGKGFESRIERSEEFVAPTEPLEGYASWGSNDSGYNAEAYHKLNFKAGSLAETFVSTSGRTFLPTTGGQSLIVDLIQQGVTGVKGYVSEPYTFALAHPDILFDRYTSGRNLAESFYSASLVIKWKDVVIGDPLCSPYARK